MVFRSSGGSTSMWEVLRFSGGSASMWEVLGSSGGSASMWEVLRSSCGSASMWEVLRSSSGSASMWEVLRSSGGSASMWEVLRSSGGSASMWESLLLVTSFCSKWHIQAQTKIRAGRHFLSRAQGPHHVHFQGPQANFQGSLHRNTKHQWQPWKWLIYNSKFSSMKIIVLKFLKICVLWPNCFKWWLDVKDPLHHYLNQEFWARFLSLAQSKLRLYSANHKAGYFSNLACDWLSIVWAYSEQQTENGPRTKTLCWLLFQTCTKKLTAIYSGWGYISFVMVWPPMMTAQFAVTDSASLGGARCKTASKSWWWFS